MDIEDRIKEQRTNEAISKNLMGAEGKLFLIAKYLGHAITKQSTDYNTLDIDDFWSDLEEIPTLDESTSFYDIGYFYEGNLEGNRIEIVCKEDEANIKMFLDGYLYYEEDGGALQKYYPYPPLEKLVENLYNRVEQLLKIKLAKYQKEEEKQMPIEEQRELNRLREKWGNII